MAQQPQPELDYQLLLQWTVEHQRDLLTCLSRNHLTAEQRQQLLRQSFNILAKRLLLAGVTLTAAP